MTKINFCFLYPQNFEESIFIYLYSFHYKLIYSIVIPSNQKNKLFPFDFFDNQTTPSTITSNKKDNIIMLPQISSNNPIKKPFDQKEVKIIDFQKEYEEDLEFLEMFDQQSKFKYI
jgi:hypothetical protein